MKHVLLIGLAAALLAGCQSTTTEADATPAPAQPPTAAEPADDSCGATAYASLVGQDRAGAPASTEGRPVRVVCSTCPMTMDYNAQRLNVIFDEKTGVVQKLNCG